MNRGSARLAVWWRTFPQRFNEAPIHESGKCAGYISGFSYLYRLQ